MTVKDIIDKLNSGASRISLGLCANGGCFHQRRRGRIKSQFCQECSDKHNRKDEYSEGAAYTATPNIEFKDGWFRKLLKFFRIIK